MPKLKTKISSEVIEVSGLKVIQWVKLCPYCKKEYKTTSRHQKFCCESCSKKAQKKRQKQQKQYSATKEIARLSARSHAIGVEVLTQLDRLGVKPKVCEVCGTVEGLQVHHINANWLDNTPSNLQWLCTKCHADAHSKMEAKAKLQGKEMVDIYDQSLLPIISILNKNCDE